MPFSIETIALNNCRGKWGSEHDECVRRVQANKSYHEEIDRLKSSQEHSFTRLRECIDKIRDLSAENEILKEGLKKAGELLTSQITLAGATPEEVSQILRVPEEVIFPKPDPTQQ